MTHISFAGNLAKDVEIRFTPSGRQVARLTVIENRRRPAENGNGWEDAEPNVYNVQVWGSAAENVTESAGKGDRVVVIGTIVTDRWTDKESGGERTSQHVKADEVAFSLKFHTVRATKATRSATREKAPATENPQD